MTTRKLDEVSSWLTPNFIAHSELLKYMWFDNRDFWERHGVEDAERWLYSFITQFACGGCYELANAVALETDSKILLVNCPSDQLVAHATLFDAQTATVGDIFSVRAAVALVGEFKQAVGDITLHVVDAYGDVSSKEDHEDLVRIAAALPWLPRTRRLTPFDEFYYRVKDRAARKKV